MHFLDFLNEPPKIYIFQKEKNKTNFGGVLFLIYIIIMIMISLIYIFDYAFNDKYTYEALSFRNSTNDKAELERIYNDPAFYPYIDLNFSFQDTDKFAIENPREPEYWKYHENSSYYNFKVKAYDVFSVIYYRCGTDENCRSIHEFRKKVFANSFGRLQIKYPKNEINHGKDIPVYENNSEFVDCYFYFHSDERDIGLRYIYYEWEKVKYVDQKSLLDVITKRKTDYIFGHINNKYDIFEEYEDYKHEIKMKFNNSDSKYYYYLPLFTVIMINNHQEYLYYKRSKVSILDVIAKVGSLFSTIKFFFTFFFYFYAKNFDNYKIFQSLFEHKYPKGSNIKIKFDKFSEKAKIKDVQPNQKNLLSINNDIDTNDELEENNKNEKDKNESEDDIILEKLGFFQFFFNNIYCKCCKRIKNQDTINNINEIIYKYLSKDYLLYSGLLFENLLEDYKWNNPLLNDIHNNNSIIKFKNT